jgi:two-component system, OmpR family, sensor histidine kinase TctE
LQQIAVGVDRAGRLVNQLLTLARTEGMASDQLEQKPLDLVELAKDVVSDWVMVALDKGIDLGFEAEGEIEIMGAEFLLRELTKNLIDNALRYTPAAGHVTCRVHRQLDRVRLSVEDDGVGISPDQAEMVFERFYRADDSSSEGSGLGLAIVQEIAQLHAASAVLVPNTGRRGVTAIVDFPAWYPPPPPMPIPDDYSELYRQSSSIGS